MRFLDTRRRPTRSNLVWAVLLPAVAMTAAAPLRRQEPCESVDPDWSSDDGWIVFASNCEGNLDLYRVRVDGSEMARLTESEAKEHNPSFSPDGSRVAYTEHHQHGSDLKVMDLSDRAVRTALSNEYGNFGATWSPDGAALAYESTREGNGDIFLVDLREGVETRLTRSEAREVAPAWSPDGSLIAFQSNVDGRYAIYGVDPSRRTEPRRLFGFDGQAVAPGWAPDGKSLVFACVMPGEEDTEICTAEPGSSDLVRLTDDDRDDFSPTFSSDGREIAFIASLPQGGWEVRILSLAEGIQTALPRPGRPGRGQER